MRFVSAWVKPGNAVAAEAERGTESTVRDKRREPTRKERIYMLEVYSEWWGWWEQKMVRVGDNCHPSRLTLEFFKG
jgi:hypothetical protein